MTARLLEGKVFAAKLKEEAGKKAKYGITPGLAVIIVGGKSSFSGVCSQ